MINFAEFPETLNWQAHDVMSVVNIAETICYAIKDDLATKDRLLVPGLRFALNLILANYGLDEE